MVSWWDDYNFWATDVKSIFYRNGFADKYANAAPEFGDYPPGTQMMAKDPRYGALQIYYDVDPQ